MDVLARIQDRLRRDFFRARYRRAARQVLRTTPLLTGGAPFTLLSMVQQRDVLSYLVAVKSFCVFLAPRRIVVVCDPTITEADRAVLRCHVPHIELHDAQVFAHPRLPRGGCWERLSAIAAMVRDSYVVQLDADTVTVQAIAEVGEAIRAGRGFVLGEIPDTPIRSLEATRQYALQWLGPDAHIQAIAEMEMVNVGLPANARYIRGCAGFTGFPQADNMRDSLLDYATRLSDKVGDDWKRWGSEQVTSNYLVSNASGTEPLPFPKYGTPDCATPETAFFHFIGSMRFVNDKYTATSRRAIALIERGMQ